MVKIRRAFLALVLTSCIAGCVGVNSTHEFQASETEQERKIVLGDGMLHALREKSYSEFIINFSADLKTSVPEAAFQKLHSDLKERKETIAQWSLLDTLDRGGIYQTEIWKLVLTKAAKNGKANIERLFYVTSAKLDGKTVVIGFKFDALF